MTISTWTTIVTSSFFGLSTEGFNRYAAKDRRYIITAITTTTNTFEPSGSSKSKNIPFDNAMDVIPKISNDIFFDLNIFVSIL